MVGGRDQRDSSGRRGRWTTGAAAFAGLAGVAGFAVGGFAAGAVVAAGAGAGAAAAVVAVAGAGSGAVAAAGVVCASARGSPPQPAATVASRPTRARGEEERATSHVWGIGARGAVPSPVRGRRQRQTGRGARDGDVDRRRLAHPRDQAEPARRSSATWKAAPIAGVR